MAIIYQTDKHAVYSRRLMIDNSQYVVANALSKAIGPSELLSALRTQNVVAILGQALLHLISLLAEPEI
jgi:hypothetical protein